MPGPAAGEPLPAVLLPVWSRPVEDDPSLLPLQLHFDLKERLGLPAALMTACATRYLAPVRHGDRLRTVEVLRRVDAERTNRLGTGRSWVIDVEHRNQHDALVGVETWTAFAYVPLPPAERGGPERPGADTRPAPAAPAAPADPADPAGDVRQGRSGTVVAGRGAAWVVHHELTAADVIAVSVAVREHRPVHVDPAAARSAGLRDVVLGTTGQQLWLWRTIASVAGPAAAPTRLDLRMRAPVTPGWLTIAARATGPDVSLTLATTPMPLDPAAPPPPPATTATAALHPPGTGR